MNETPAYGLWSLVVLNSLLFIIFAPATASVRHVRQPQHRQDHQ